MFQLTTNDIEAPEITQSLDELAREGARRMIVAALELEVDQYVQELRHLRDELDHAMVVRNGYAQERTVQLGAGPVKVRAPRVNDRRPDHRFTSKILPPYMRRSPRPDEALPVPYLRGLSTGDFSEALEALLGREATGFSATTIPIESTFSTVKARTKTTKGAGSRKAGLAMAFKLLLAAEKRWRKVNSPPLVALVKAGVEFPNGEAEMPRSEPAPEVFTLTPSISAAEETLIHNI